MSSRVKPLRVKGEWKEEVFSPIPVKILSSVDFFYGPTETKKLSDIWSRHKLAWLWATVHEAIERDSGLVYHAVLEMIEKHGGWLDEQKGEKEWPKILRGYRWERGIVLPGERKSAGQMTMAQWKEGYLLSTRKPVTEDDFVLTAYDSLSCGGESLPPAWNMIEIVAALQDDGEAEMARFSAEQVGLRPAR